MHPQMFTTQVCRALPEQVQSVVLFGSAAAGDFISGISQYDVLVVLKRLGIEELETLGPAVREWRQAGNPLPLLFTSEQLAAATDAFALEILEMQHDRRVLFGSDPIVSLTVDRSHVAMHLERELRGKSLALRDQYALAAGDAGRIGALLCDSLSSFLSLFRVALQFYQAEGIPSRKLDAMRALAGHVGFDPEPFAMVEELKERRRSLVRVDARALFRSYWQSIELVIDAVDRRIHPSD